MWSHDTPFDDLSSMKPRYGHVDMAKLKIIR